jgi:hypothetical protein
VEEITTLMVLVRKLGRHYLEDVSIDGIIRLKLN